MRLGIPLILTDAEVCMDIDIQSIRNFCIIAHLDHGKSTRRSDSRITDSIDGHDMTSRVLDKMDLD